ncbi:DUF4203 domain-containing protein [Candidatus Saccharibacteria bacterium]|nr:DUF4203 domain-containing protein [Candidatus Saccharibacteria bacterium]
MNLDFSGSNEAEFVVLAVVGLLLLFAGYRIKKIAFFLIWFFIGFTLMGYLMPELSKTVPEIAQNDLWQNLLPLAGGLLVALMGFTIEKICIGGIAFGLVMMVTAQYFGTEMQTLIIGAVVGVVAAGASVMLMKPAIIVASSLAGSYMITAGILHWVQGIDAETMYFPILIGVTAVGSVTQFLTTKRL